MIKAQKIKAAFFDVDGTLVPRISTERIFAFYLLQRRIIGIQQGWHFFRYFLNHPEQWADSIFKRDKAYLRGLESRDLRRYARECFKERIEGRISEKGRREIQKRHEEGARVILLTGSLECLVAPIARYLEVDGTIHSRLRLEKGVVTGEIEGLHPYGEKKRILLERYAYEREVDLSESYGYADSYQDIVFLEGVGNPVAVNPDRKLKEYAKHRQWPIVEF
ncbi:MAG: HAD-IB family hydrolase [Deltaproteobacteria bacterium]|nr:HAD-IB family hydrolase [Deltaproteobacteria bacterium]